jgi:hypothetical protein
MRERLLRHVLEVASWTYNVPIKLSDTLIIHKTPS